MSVQQVLWEFAPLFGLSFSIFALKGFRMSHSARWAGGLLMHLMDILLSSATGAFLIVGLCIIVRAVRPQLHGEAIIGVAIFFSVGGVALVDSALHKYFGVRLVDPHLKPRGELHGGREKEDE